jgi:hypothetical protein
MGDLISNNLQQPVNEFILIEPYETVKTKTNYRLKGDDGMRIKLFKLKGKHLVSATFRLYHELASITVHRHNPALNDWDYNTCSDFNLGDNISTITRLRYHHRQHPQLRYFTTCLTNYHNSDPNKFDAAHPNWEFGHDKKKPVCVLPMQIDKMLRCMEHYRETPQKKKSTCCS